MTIHLYLNNEEETEITTMFDMQSNPFKIGDILHLNVEELYPNDYKKYKEDFQRTLIQSNKELEQNFRRKTVKLVKVYNSLEFKVMKKPRLTIDYYCEFIDE
ncbi:MAG: hypothetical protein GY849_00725 [Deltaproteobacteria bacterium]|nr:hypothetical protein [Deltaproteobacteria bacterium]